MKLKTTKRGFSLIEVLIAIGVVATGILALLAVFITGTRSNEHGSNLTDATYYARKIAESIRAEQRAFNHESGSVPPPANSGVNDADGVWRELDATPFLDVRRRKIGPDGLEILDAGVPQLVSGDARYERHIEMRRASTNVADYNYDNVIVDVSIRWETGKSDGHRQMKITTVVKRGV